VQGGGREAGIILRVAAGPEQLAKVGDEPPVDRDLDRADLGRPDARIGDVEGDSAAAALGGVASGQLEVGQRVGLDQPLVLVDQLLHHLAVVPGDPDRDEGDEQGADRQHLVEPVMAGAVGNVRVRLLDLDVHGLASVRHTRIGIST
jgi:hypothetical protein